MMESIIGFGKERGFSLFFPRKKSIKIPARYLLLTFGSFLLQLTATLMSCSTAVWESLEGLHFLYGMSIGDLINKVRKANKDKYILHTSCICITHSSNIAVTIHDVFQDEMKVGDWIPLVGHDLKCQCTRGSLDASIKCLPSGQPLARAPHILLLLQNVIIKQDSSFFLSEFQKTNVQAQMFGNHSKGLILHITKKEGKFKYIFLEYYGDFPFLYTVDVFEFSLA